MVEPIPTGLEGQIVPYLTVDGVGLTVDVGIEFPVELLTVFTRPVELGTDSFDIPGHDLPLESHGEEETPEGRADA